MKKTIKEHFHDSLPADIAALAEARKLWPDEHFRVTSEAGNLLKNPHDGVVDAALLATYGMRKRI